MTGLVKKIDKLVSTSAGKTPRPVGVYVIFDSKANGLEGQLRALAEKEALKHLMICIGAPPEDYGVTKSADMSIVIYKAGKRRHEMVTANFALRKSELNDAKADAIVKALAEALPK